MHVTPIHRGRPLRIAVHLHRLLVVLGLSVVGAVAVAAGDPEGGFEIPWSSIDGGGGASLALDLRLDGTIGQADVGVLSGGDLELRGGFRAAARPVVPPCVADLGGDGLVGFDDLLVILGAWGSCEGCPADLDGDGDVAFSDLLVLLSAWGPCPTS